MHLSKCLGYQHQFFLYIRSSWYWHHSCYTPVLVMTLSYASFLQSFNLSSSNFICQCFSKSVFFLSARLCCPQRKALYPDKNLKYIYCHFLQTNYFMWWPILQSILLIFIISVTVSLMLLHFYSFEVILFIPQPFLAFTWHHNSFSNNIKNIPSAKSQESEGKYTFYTPEKIFMSHMNSSQFK